MASSSSCRRRRALCGSPRSGTRCSPGSRSARSEEHTSELQSHSDLVCRLLLARRSPELYTLSLHDALPILTSARHVVSIDLEKANLMIRGVAEPFVRTRWPYGELEQLPAPEGVVRLAKVRNPVLARLEIREIGRAHV